jgi:hypothetical protein
VPAVLKDCNSRFLDGKSQWKVQNAKWKSSSQNQAGAFDFDLAVSFHFLAHKTAPYGLFALELVTFHCCSIAVPFFLPRIAPVVITVAFPEAEFVTVQELQTVDPFGTLPDVQVRNHQAQRTAVFDWQRFTLE